MRAVHAAECPAANQLEHRQVSPSSQVDPARCAGRRATGYGERRRVGEDLSRSISGLAARRHLSAFQGDPVDRRAIEDGIGQTVEQVIIRRTVHLLGEPQQRPASRFACRVGRRLAERVSQFVVGIADLDARNDGLPFLWLETAERLLVILDGLPADRLFERRSRADILETLQIGHVRLSRFAPQFIAKTVEDGLSQIRLQRPDRRGSNSPILLNV